MTENDPASGAKGSRLDAWRRLLGGGPSALRNAALARFEATVEKLLQTCDEAALGRLHFFNLQELIVRRGEDQKTRLKKIEAIVLSVIRQNLKESETYIRPEINTVFFLFPALTCEAGGLKCATIADQVAQALMKEDPIFADLKSERSVQNVDRRTWSVSRDPPQASAGLSDDAKGAANPVSPASVKTESPEIPSPQKSGGTGRSDAASSPPLASTDPRLAGIQVVYQAIWNVRSKLITSYAAIPQRRYPDGTTMTGRRILGADTGVAMTATLDSFVQRESVAWLNELINAGQKLLFVLPIHFSTVDSQAFFFPYRQELAALAHDARKHIVLEILHAPDTLPAFRIKEVVSRLRPLARCVLVRLPLDSILIRQWAESGVHGTGFAASEEMRSEKYIMRKMDAFVARAEKSAVHTFAHDLPSPSLTAAAVAAGFRYIGGEGILPKSATPKPIEPFECQNIFAAVTGA